MVLDTIKDGKFIFKNTYADNKQVEIPVGKGPLEFYFVHIELNEEGLEQLRIKKEIQVSSENQSSKENPFESGIERKRFKKETIN